MTHGHTSRKDGYQSPTYQSWRSMKKRCNLPNATGYGYYGGRGITYDARWEIFEAFLLDMGERPDGKTLDRTNPSGNYCKENCRWATPAEQMFSQRVRYDNANGVRGVSFQKAKNRWRARGTLKGKTKIIYYGTSYEEAVAARRAWGKANNV